MKRCTVDTFRMDIIMSKHVLCLFVQDSTLAGFHVPKGHCVIYISHSVHRDPEVFQQPDRFLPERWSGR